MARPAFQPTEEQRRWVEQLAAFGVPVEEMRVLALDARGKPISGRTLRKHFQDELKTGALKANIKIAQCLFRKATEGDTTAMIFWLKTRAGWKQTDPLELTGKGGAPIQTQRVSADLSRLSDEELDRLEQLAEKCAAQGDIAEVI